MSEKAVLITGAGGALAKAAIQHLKDTHKVVAVDFRFLPEFPEDIPCYKVDLNKRGFEDIFRNHDIGTVIHLGRIGAGEYDRHRRYNSNVLGTQRLLNLSNKYGISQVLVLSTFFVYGAHAYNPALLDENAPLKASNLTLDLVDSVELENLATLYLWKHPNLNITILRPCHIAGPGVRNSMSLLLSRKFAPTLLGFSPMMQFLHVEDMALAIIACLNGNKPGIYNVAPEDWIPYQQALLAAGCTRLPLPSIPPLLPNQISKLLHWKAFPSFLINFFKYPVIINGRLFKETFNFEPKRPLDDIFSHYREKKGLTEQLKRAAEKAAQTATKKI